MLATFFSFAKDNKFPLKFHFLCYVVLILICLFLASEFSLASNGDKFASRSCIICSWLSQVEDVLTGKY